MMKRLIPSDLKCRCDNHTVKHRETQAAVLAFLCLFLALGCSQAIYIAGDAGEKDGSTTECKDATPAVVWPDPDPPGGCAPVLTPVDGQVHWTGEWVCPFPRPPIPDPQM